MVLKKRIRIEDIQIKPKRIKQLNYLIDGSTVTQFAARFDYNYNYANQILSVWHCKGWLKKFKTLGNKVIYKVDTKLLEYSKI